MRVEFAVSAGLHFRETEIVEYDDDATDEYLNKEYSDWVFDRIDGGWQRLSEANDD